MSKQLNALIRDEWLLVLSAGGLVFTSALARRLPSYSASDFEILYILGVLFVITSGLQKHGVLEAIAVKIENGSLIAVKLVLVAFFFSMIVTNDVALLALVPLTLLLNVPHKSWLVILEALAANAGSALSPFGNPQNLFIYWHYTIPFDDFLITILPFSLTFLGLLVIAAISLQPRHTSVVKTPRTATFDRLGWFYILALVIFALAILRVLPLALGGIILACALLSERQIPRIDYALLLTFACFFGFTDNLQILLQRYLAHPHHTFLLAVFLSQIISNVPTALLLADFSGHWKSLLWGVSVGGFGSLVGSLANLIAYRIYVRHNRHETRAFTIKFHIASYTFFFIRPLAKVRKVQDYR